MINKKENFIQQLYKEIDEELNKESEQMDIDKIRILNTVIAHLEGVTKLPKSLCMENFFNEFDMKYGFKFYKKEN